jgi:hypothetical protein
LNLPPLSFCLHSTSLPFFPLTSEAFIASNPDPGCIFVVLEPTNLAVAMEVKVEKEEEENKEMAGHGRASSSTFSLFVPCYI